jgi:hypothetical protein
MPTVGVARVNNQRIGVRNVSDQRFGVYGRWLATLGVLGSGLACSGADGFDELAEDDVVESDSEAAIELGQAEQAWWTYGGLSSSYLSSSCSDPTGTDSVLAALAVATAQELRRWQPTIDFQISNDLLALTTTGKARCADGKCMNTQALLDMQKASTSIQVRPGVKVSPSTLKTRLKWNFQAQKNCTTSFFSSCRAPDHEFRFLYSEPGSCDMNFWFDVRTPAGGLLGSTLKSLQEKLVWVDAEDNSYIKFQTEGSAIAIDPTYGLNVTTATTSASCSAACTKVSGSSIAGQCCSCNGTKKYAKSAWSATTFICQ